ncbi:hypothetical protein FNF27_00624 [Cafeteria roenbergensis]|uniref:SAM domain-containing protein n=1 Tax=Cafeteria roenbergensis TaxID=33653 RepID=A0A5A8DD72_CAFRO|nr:hypothetical protein FNF29_00070 [Cafeteria roenbergensis]KAA0162160.1 hypothetical protein FNF31_03395 [Cafeteria roenbergensis]KAA0162526.1 hypothetical protein FNF28_04700 [Cafeteria roenbergensis]KAA0178076.1 hypothetical protein FNF27_00624 [Cafeteria roenbergensis]|eukprot:KAA0157494.1 hypothetical protein FNF29_00070 [Cafeteria roenbergensis]
MAQRAAALGADAEDDGRASELDITADDVSAADELDVAPELVAWLRVQGLAHLVGVLSDVAVRTPAQVRAMTASSAREAGLSSDDWESILEALEHEP